MKYCIFRNLNKSTMSVNSVGFSSADYSEINYNSNSIINESNDIDTTVIYF